MIYYKGVKNEKLILLLCIICDDLKHDVKMVHEVKKKKEIAVPFVSFAFVSAFWKF